MGLREGATLGHYRIVSRLGAGGMGEVFLARDTQLDRDVALKVLPAELARDADRMRRFVQEAKAASALNHPNICVIHEIGEAALEEGPQHFIVMEYVDGQPLDRKIAGRPLPLAEILDLGLQLADALDEAHSKGITHRDIKPGNVLVTLKGQTKILDFGLAKIGRPGGHSAETNAATEAMTQPGMVMGTIQYMSPEQALGRPVDHRTDIFSLGAVLYEMGTGRRPFQGTTSAALFDELLNKTPAPPASINPAIPAKLDEIITKALEKERDIRYQTAADLRADLKRLKRDTDSGRISAPTMAAPVPEVSKRPARRWMAAAAALAGALLIATGAWLRWGRSVTTGPESAPNVIPFTTYAGSETWPAFSPDGKQVAFAWDGPEGDNVDIYVRLIDSGTPLRLTTDPAAETNPTWSPDGARIAFIRRSGNSTRVFVVPALGGPERKIADIPAQAIDWSPDGKFLAVSEQNSTEEPARIVLLSVDSGEKRPLTAPPAKSFGDGRPAFSPDGRSVVFTRVTDFGISDLYLAPASNSGAIPEPRSPSEN